MTLLVAVARPMLARPSEALTLHGLVSRRQGGRDQRVHPQGFASASQSLRGGQPGTTVPAHALRPPDCRGRGALPWHAERCGM